MKDEIIIYQADEQSTRLEVRIEEDTVWLTQAQMADLFQTTRNNITLHISNIFKEKELVEFSVGKESLLTAGDGKKYKTKFYVSLICDFLSGRELFCNTPIIKFLKKKY
jgi:hypothetical protein